ncbi:TIGR02996 domain-containing protein [Gemmata sp. G18]|uniref:TIGR02996 domain-containing protein n=1 Tax=Gemmata palustris TaxID=2822762 RepID=A0ABS5BKA8_9BACT|nr:TIGR02996 domain-containing protein [Gemmata palustris]MBP3954144.1 TIGR02996 domain-containing protein [Gemmata palustris]
MSDEAAFLAALKANPADDTTRLVYADWLDEHNEPVKAEYLRLVVNLPTLGDDIDLISGKATHANKLGAALPTQWKEAAAARFDLVMLDYSDKIKSIKRIREVFKVQLGSAIAIAHYLPNRVLTWVSIDAAGQLLPKFDDSTMRLAVRPSDRIGNPTPTLFSVVAECYDWKEDGPGGKASAQTDLLTLVSRALNLPESEAAQRLTTRPVVLLDGASLIEAAHLEERSQELTTHLTSCRVTRST